MQTKSKLQVEVAATVDWGKPLVKACYHLEGDGLLAHECFETVDQVIASVATENIPNVRAIAQKLTKQSHYLFHAHFMNSGLILLEPAYGVELITSIISLLLA